MPTKLYRFTSKEEFLSWCRKRGYNMDACSKAWSGSGYYYARSHKHISKWSRTLDLRRRRKIGSGAWRHLHDKTMKELKRERKTKKKKTTTKKKKTVAKKKKTSRKKKK